MEHVPRDAERVLAEQVAYYRARAPEYDQWFLRQGRYNRGEEATRRWFAELEQVRAALAKLPIDGAEVLELAPGTGIWTELLVDRARSVTAVDASPEMIEENRRRLGRRADAVSFIVADLFDWRPVRTFDAVVFCFWISHVPEERLDPFLRGVREMLRPGGTVFFVDSRREPTSTAGDHELPPEEDEVMVRRLDNGAEFRIVKNFWEATLLKDRFEEAGLEVQIEETPTYFIYGKGVST